MAEQPGASRHIPQALVGLVDSGYYGSQSQDAATDLDQVMEDVESLQPMSAERIPEEQQQSPGPLAETRPQDNLALTTSLLRKTSQSAKEDQDQTVASPSPAPEPQDDLQSTPIAASSPVQLLGNESPDNSPAKASQTSAQAEQTEILAVGQQVLAEHVPETEPEDDDGTDVTRSPSDGSSPIRPLVRKSSLNFASLPAREPLTSKKSLGARMSRTSHIDQTRTSYYPRQTGGKSIGVRQDELEEEEDDEMRAGEDDATELVGRKDSVFAAPSKSYTQRLQDQISMLGKSQASGARPSKSIHNLAGTQQTFSAIQSTSPQDVPVAAENKSQSPPQHQQLARTPGTFPEDDEDDWIAPPTTIEKVAINPSSPRPGFEKSHSTDIMEGLHRKSIVGCVALDPGQDQSDSLHPDSPLYSPQMFPVSHPGRPVSGHGKSVSVPDMRHDIFGRDTGQNLVHKAVAVSNPVMENLHERDLVEPSKSPTRSVRESPTKHNALKQVKNKFSSILKGSKGLLASSAALSAETKASLRNSPSVTKMHKQSTKSTESLAPEKEEESLYPDLSKHASSDSQPAPSFLSPLRSNSRKTRSSAERDRRDQKQKEKEEKETQHLTDQMEKLERAREIEREKAHLFSKGKHDKLAAEKQVDTQKEQEGIARTPAPKSASQPTRTSPRKAQAQLDTETRGRAEAETIEDEVAEPDVEMADAPTTKAPPSIPRPTATPGQSFKSREIKRPVKPTRDTTSKPKQAPTLIRVNTSSQHGGFHPSNSVLASTLHETLNNSQQPAKGKTVLAKTSVQNLGSSLNPTTGRPKALELADKRRQEEEKKAQRKRELKAEMERKREEGRRQEEERRETERQRVAAEEEAKKAAARQAAIERAKQTKAPPPAPRFQPNGSTGSNSVREKAPVSRPPSRLGHSTLHRSQEEISRPVNVVLSTSAKMSMKRPLQHDGVDDGVSRPAGPRGGPIQQKEAKRMRMSDEFDPEEEMEIQSYGANIKGPPVRPSAGFKKVSRAPATLIIGSVRSPTLQDQPNKSLFASGYAPAPQSVTRDIFKAPPVASHHSKSGHPLDMAQVSKAHIPFASSQHGAGPSSHKTPARPAVVTTAKSAAKSAKRSSPRFQNGENIELPEIQTDEEDDDDEDDEAKGLGVASWADTPELRRELMRQETLDPLQVFGPPAPLKLEEVFKNKDRWNKFRARGSSANWGGTDRLTEEEIRKDMAAREKMRRDGGWSYELSKDMR